jgi:signal transduction histidine kinase
MAMGATGDTCTAHRFDRASWVAIGVVLLIAVASVAVTIASLVQVGDGCVYDWGNVEAKLFGACVGGWTTPLRAGDELLAVAGVARPDTAVLAQPQRPPGWTEGGTVHYTVRRAGQTLDLDVPLHRMGWDGILRAFGYGLARQTLEWNTLVFLGALVIFALAPRARAAQLLLVAIGGLTAVTTLLWPGWGVGTDLAPGPVWLAATFLDGVWVYLFVPTVLLLVLNFPRRVWPLTRWPRLTLGLIFGLPLAATAVSFITTNGVFFLAVLGFGALCVFVATIVITTHTFLRVRDPVVRAQTAWLAFGLALGLAFWPLFYVLSFVFPGLFPAVDRLPWWLVLFLTALSSLTFPVCLGVAITRYRLFAIDVVINRALVYGTLTACVIGVYVGLVSYLSSLFRAQNGLVSPLIATGIVAVLFQPLRERLQRGVNRLMYGERDEPYAVMARLGQRLEGTLAVDDLLPTIAETVARALKVPSVALSVKHRGELTLAAEYVTERRAPDAASPQSPASVALPLIAQGETVGELRLALRPGESAFSPADQRLLNDLTRQAGIAVQAARLTTDLRQLTVDLQQSRERLVTTREEERRRLRRDLHDGLGPALASLTFKVDAARNLLRRDVAKADTLLASVVDQMQETIADIRRLVYDLRPPALDQLGLAAALRQYVAHLDTSTHITVEAPADFTALPAAVEVAAYRIALEAITNVLRHAAAQQCVVALMIDQRTLIVEVRDTGQGLPAQLHAGVGLRAMHERATELGGICTIEAVSGGGTVMQARLPLIAHEPLERK